MITVYGIRNCDTVRKARRWLEAQGVDYHYHDLREDGLDARTLDDWLAALGIDGLVNRRSTSWKALPEATRASFDEAAAREHILARPTLLKRPLLATGSSLHSGFNAETWARLPERHTL
jgi:Spx/MgsR family transcriptional regulator